MLITMEGKLKWTRVVTPEEYEGKKSWSTTIYPNDAGVMKVMEIKAEGVKNNLKKDMETGEWFIKFSRPVEVKKKDKVVKVLTPPVVTDADGNVIDGDTVGNGSEAIITLDLYEHAVKGGGKSKAARLESIKITKLEAYDG